MGSSTKKFQKTIKKIMENIDPSIIDNSINTIFYETIKLKKNKSFFYNSEFGNAVMGGISAINGINAGKFHEIQEKIHSIEHNTDDQIIVQDILDIILDNLDRDGSSITDELILRAFKITMAELILDKDLSIYHFLELFVKKSLLLLILEDTHEPSLEEFGFITTNEIEKKLEALSDHLVDKYLISSIHQYANGKIQFENLVDDILSLKSKVNED